MSNSAIKLQIMICTCSEKGLQRVASMQLPLVDGVQWLVSCQSAPYPLPQALMRDDIVVYFTASTGLSNNRNHALSHVTAPFALIADDDLIYKADDLEQIILALETNPDVDIATFMSKGADNKIYPLCPHPLDKPFKGYYITSFEIAFRTRSVREAGLWFSPLMGIGADYLHAGEENMFVYNALMAGLKGMFFPIVSAEHPHPTTGTRDQDKPGVLRANGAHICLTYPALEVMPRLVLKAHRSRGNTLRNLWFLVQGACYGIRHKEALLHPKP